MKERNKHVEIVATAPVKAIAGAAIIMTLVNVAYLIEKLLG
jgi:hypothetical protein